MKPAKVAVLLGAGLALLVAPRAAMADEGDVVATSVVSFDSLPTGEIPAPLERAGESTTESMAVRLGGVGDVDKWRAAKGDSTSFPARVSGVLPGLVQLGKNAPSENVWVGCVKRPAGVAPAGARVNVALRWETFAVDTNGDGVWSISDGWVDANACRVMHERTTTLRAKPLATLGGKPIAYGLRIDGELVVLLPPTDSLAGDVSIESTLPLRKTARFVRGPISRVTLPTAKGGVSTAAGVVGSDRVARWMGAVRGKEVHPASPARVVTMRIEVSHAVAEASATVFVRASVASDAKFE